MPRHPGNLYDFIIDYIDEDSDWGDLAQALDSDRNFPRAVVRQAQRAYIRQKMEPWALTVFDQINQMYVTGHDPRPASERP